MPEPIPTDYWRQQFGTRSRSRGPGTTANLDGIVGVGYAIHVIFDRKVTRRQCQGGCRVGDLSEATTASDASDGNVVPDLASPVLLAATLLVGPWLSSEGAPADR